MQSDKLIIANCSGFYGDRLSAAAEMVRGGPIDVLTGDYLAELTLAILYRVRSRNPKAGYAASFLKQMEAVLGECLDKRIKVVVNAGGLNPSGLAAELQALADRLGLKPKIAYIDGDDLLPRMPELLGAGEIFKNLDTGDELSPVDGTVVTANAYLGGWGIAAALERGADVVIAPRVTDAALVVGPAAWRFGWKQTDWDCLAGAVAAGHIIECGPQACGGNYSFFEEVPSFRNMGFPIAEMYADGSCVITKHPGTGGIVNVGTVTAQLLYEVRGPRYPNPDVTARFDTLAVEQAGVDRVRVSGAKGEEPPQTAKVAMNLQAGFRNSMTIFLASPQIEQKARILEEQLWESLGALNLTRLEMLVERTDTDDARSNRQAVAEMHVDVFADTPEQVGRPFSSKVVELALSTVPGFKLASPPGDAEPNLYYWPTLIANKHVRHCVHIDGETIAIDTPQQTALRRRENTPRPLLVENHFEGAQFVTAPLGAIIGARSGDKGGSANLGVWARSDEAYEFMLAFLTEEKLRELLPDLTGYSIERYDFPNLRAVNYYIVGILGSGAISSSRFDPQAKTLGEYLRSHHVPIPVRLLETGPRTTTTSHG